jgi:hypothetical protein
MTEQLRRQVREGAAALLSSGDQHVCLDPAVYCDLAAALAWAGGTPRPDACPLTRAMFAAVTDRDLRPAFALAGAQRREALLVLAEIVGADRAASVARALIEAEALPTSPRLPAVLALTDARAFKLLLAALERA